MQKVKSFLLKRQQRKWIENTRRCIRNVRKPIPLFENHKIRPQHSEASHEKNVFHWTVRESDQTSLVPGSRNWELVLLVCSQFQWDRTGLGTDHPDRALCLIKGAFVIIPRRHASKVGYSSTQYGSMYPSLLNLVIIYSSI